MVSERVVGIKEPLLFLWTLLILISCSSSNAIGFDVDSQCVYPIKGSMKCIEVSKMDGDRVFSILFGAGDEEAGKPLAIQNLQPNHIYQIRNSGGDRGSYVIYVETDSTGKVTHLMEQDELPARY